MATAAANVSPAAERAKSRGEVAAAAAPAASLLRRAREVVERPSYANLLATVTLMCTVTYFVLSLGVGALRWGGGDVGRGGEVEEGRGEVRSLRGRWTWDLSLRLSWESHAVGLAWLCWWSVGCV